MLRDSGARQSPFVPALLHQGPVTVGTLDEFPVEGITFLLSPSLMVWPVTELIPVIAIGLREQYIVMIFAI